MAYKKPNYSKIAEPDINGMELIAADFSVTAFVVVIGVIVVAVIVVAISPWECVYQPHEGDTSTTQCPIHNQ